MSGISYKHKSGAAKLFQGPDNKAKVCCGSGKNAPCQPPSSNFYIQWRLHCPPFIFASSRHLFNLWALILQVKTHQKPLEEHSGTGETEWTCHVVHREWESKENGRCASLTKLYIYWYRLWVEIFEVGVKMMQSLSVVLNCFEFVLFYY